MRFVLKKFGEIALSDTISVLSRDSAKLYRVFEKKEQLLSYRTKQCIYEHEDRLVQAELQSKVSVANGAGSIKGSAVLINFFSFYFLQVP